MALGGLLRAVALARRAADVGIDAYVTGLIDGELGRAAAAQVACVLPTTRAHGLATGALLEAPDRAGWLQPERGVLTVSTLPGLGAEGAR
jgi:L-alanine-DL-glutamate epimerase-like enolase superfamily enzyme